MAARGHRIIVAGWTARYGVHMPRLTDLRISVLDQGQIPQGEPPRRGVADTIDLAKIADVLGFSRFWVTEHHGSIGYASSAPSVLIAAIASVTRNIRAGSGALLLPNYSSLVVAEQFGTLVALFGNRIDLGIGRSTGADPRTAAILRGNADDIPEEEFLRKLEELSDFYEGTFRLDGHKILALPGEGDAPEIWLLGSSEYSARLAGKRGMRFSFAHHFSGDNVEVALNAYRHSFVPGAHLQKPYCSISVGVISDEDPDVAEAQARPALIDFVLRRQGKPARSLNVEDGIHYDFSDDERRMIEQRHRRQAIGTPANVERILNELQVSTHADEILAVPWGAEKANRERTLRILAGIFDLSPHHE